MIISYYICKWQYKTNYDNIFVTKSESKVIFFAFSTNDFTFITFYIFKSVSEVYVQDNIALHIR